MFNFNEEAVRKEHENGVGIIAKTQEVVDQICKEGFKNIFYIGIGGVVTFKNGKKMKEVVEAVPLDRILLETDSPYLAPEPNRGKRNSSLNIPYIAKQIAVIKDVSYEEVVEATNANAKRLFMNTYE